MKTKKRAFKAILSVICVLLALLVAAGAAVILAPKSEVRYVAHRGYSDRYVDNTAEAFKAAAKMNFYGIETDVRETADGIFVCNHDEFVRFADGSEKTVSSATFEELTAVPLLNKKTDSEVRVCLFEDYLKICKNGGKTAVIELKETFSRENIRRILDLVDKYYDRKNISVISFYLEPLLFVREADESIDLQYLSENRNDPVFERCLEEKINIDVRQTILTRRLVDSFHRKDLTVNVWTVNKKFDLAVVCAKQVDYVTSNLLCGE